MKKKLMILLLTVILIPGICLGSPWSPGELACFAKVDDPNFQAPEVKPRFRVLRGLRGCKSFECLAERARKSRKVLQVFVTSKNITPRVNFGNLGWARQNIAIVGSTTNHQIPDALLIARGVENFEVASLDVPLFLEIHNEAVAETKCLRRTRKCRKIRKQGGFCEASFNEVQTILPR